MRPLCPWIPLLTLLGIVLPLAATATPPWGPGEFEAFERAQVALEQAQPETAPVDPGELLRRHRTPPVGYSEMFSRVCQFLDLYQVTTPGTDFGGMREGEAQYYNIIQTDNTSEAIWVWTRYFELTGDNQYYQNILDAFTYSLAHPAYLEEGTSDSTTGYYRMYNCGWAVRAEQKYRDVYGDTTYEQYGDSCGSYIRHHTLVRSPNYNPPILAWAMGNLYHAGLHESNQAWVDRAVQQARDKVKVWVQATPTLLGNESWAMSGGATMWGMLNSYLLAVPDSTAPWVNRYKGYLDAYSSAGQFRNAWNGWYAYGHRAVGVALDDQSELALHVMLTDTLITEDRDGDGGIPGRREDGDDEDQTWISNYLAAFALDDCLGPASAVDLRAGRPGALLTFAPGAPNPFQGSTRLRLALLRAADLDLSVYDVSGRKILSLGRGIWPAGDHLIEWNGRNDRGDRIAPGVYLARLRTPRESLTRRLVLIP